MPPPCRLPTARKLRMKQLWQRGLTAKEIADDVGITTNAVLGITFRNRDEFPLRRPDQSAAMKGVKKGTRW